MSAWFHTHPGSRDGIGGDPIPSPGDLGFTKEIGVVGYLIARKGFTILNPNETYEKW